jgi:hypothetical protein
MVRVFNVTFINISVISWRSVLLVEETGVKISMINRLNRTKDIPSNLSYNVCDLPREYIEIG